MENGTRDAAIFGMKICLAQMSCRVGDYEKASRCYREAIQLLQKKIRAGEIDKILLCIKLLAEYGRVQIRMRKRKERRK